MIILLSPAKKLLHITKPYPKPTTEPIFKKQTEELCHVMQQKTPADIAKLMDLSEALAELNYHRYQTFDTTTEQYPALFFFRGDVYQTLNADHWNEETLAYAEQHLLILSGLYGLLRPLDNIRAYRLEMGTALSNSRGKNLYDFWKSPITDALNKRLSMDKNPFLVNLASTEYFKAVDCSRLQAPIVHIHFKEKKDDTLQTIGIHAKKARGAMANYLCTQHINDLEHIKAFTALNYRFCEEHSTLSQFSFVR